MFKKPSANNKVYLMKMLLMKLQSQSLERDGGIHALTLLVPLSNS